MIQKIGTYFSFSLLLMLMGNIVMAQAPAKPVSKPMVKFKPPVVFTYLGTLTGSNAVAGAEEGKRIIILPLTIMDDKKVVYTIASYQFAYNRIGVTEDEVTGKAALEKDMVADHFNATPLPAIWQSNITETLHAGESLFFFDIIAFDKQGRRFFAPELKITIQ